MADEKEYYSITELAELLGISRVAVFKKIKAGKIKAVKIGRMFVIPGSECSLSGKSAMTAGQKAIIDEGVKRTVNEYGEVLKMLGNE